jgi:hypothetical protein
MAVVCNRVKNMFSWTQYPHTARVYRISGSEIPDGEGGYETSSISIQVWSGSVDWQDKQARDIDQFGRIVKIADGKLFLPVPLADSGILEQDTVHLNMNDDMTFLTGSVVETRAIDDRIMLKVNTRK